MQKLIGTKFHNQRAGTITVEGKMLKRRILGFIAFFLSATPGASQEPSPEFLGARVASGYLVERLLLGPTFGISPNPNARPISNTALQLIKDFEGWFPVAYDDPVGYCTIGYGHLIALRECSQVNVDTYLAELGYKQPLSEESGTRLLNSDTAGARTVVQDAVTVSLNQDEFGALASFVFNVGEQNFRNSTLLRLLNLNDREGAASQFPRWVRAKGVVLRGLVIRRECERALFSGVLAKLPEGSFTRTSCAGLGIMPNNSQPLDIDVEEPPSDGIAKLKR